MQHGLALVVAIIENNRRSTAFTQEETPIG
jgi:hypothetical protein